MKQFKETLYARTKTGNVKWYAVYIKKLKDGTYEVIRKYASKIGGKEQTEVTKVVSGVNIGKANETTIREQAEVVANTKYNIKLRKGYKPEKPGTDDAYNTDKDGFVKPMLASKYDAGRITFPCFLQPKLNGVRAIIERTGKYPTVRSREGVEYTAIRHIRQVLTALPKGIRLDGELYIHGESLQKIVSAVKKHGPLTAKVRFNLFDLAMEGIPQSRRLQEMQEIFKLFKDSPIDLVPTEYCNSSKVLKQYYEDTVADGYEGIIIRMPTAEYEFGFRSRSLIKYKEMLDAEYKIVGAFEGNGREKGAIIYHCTTEDGELFGVRPIGSIEERRLIFKNYKRNPKHFKGKLLTVQYQELSDKGVPIFPVGITFRDYE